MPKARCHTGKKHEQESHVGAFQIVEPPRSRWQIGAVLAILYSLQWSFPQVFFAFTQAASLSPRMRVVIHPLHLPHCQLRVPLRRRQPLMP